jgi:hypothetical protein
MKKNNSNAGHRGSSSDHASSYKNKGHENEHEFASLIGGKVIPGQQKVDVIGPKGTRYSCKGGAVHWQILLYAEGNFINNEWGELGVLFRECLNCFPIDYSIYAQDKINAKEIIYSYLREKSGKEVYNHDDAKGLDPETKKNLKNSLRNNRSLLNDLMGLDNTYLNAKLKLQVVTKKMKEKFEEEGQIRSFLEKGMFANEDVDKLVVKEKDNFLVFYKSDVLDIFDENLKAENSVGGHGIDDINLDGQKTIIKYKTNIVELEIRNDSKLHYRQVRFNMKREKALTLFKQRLIEVKSPHAQIKYYEKY